MVFVVWVFRELLNQLLNQLLSVTRGAVMILIDRSERMFCYRNERKRLNHDEAQSVSGHRWLHAFMSHSHKWLLIHVPRLICLKTLMCLESFVHGRSQRWKFDKMPGSLRLHSCCPLLPRSPCSACLVQGNFLLPFQLNTSFDIHNHPN